MRAIACTTLLSLGAVMFGSALSSVAIAGEAYCFNAGIAKGWDCSESADSDIPIDHVYHTLKIRVAEGQDPAELGKILPIERVGEVPLPAGLPLLMAGVAAFAFAARRRRGTAATA